MAFGIHHLLFSQKHLIVFLNSLQGIDDSMLNQLELQSLIQAGRNDSASWLHYGAYTTHAPAPPQHGGSSGVIRKPYDTQRIIYAERQLIFPKMIM